MGVVLGIKNVNNILRVILKFNRKIISKQAHIYEI